MTEFARRRPAMKPASPKAAANASDQRFAPRRDDFIPAILRLEGTTYQTPCVVRDMSTTGARLEMKPGWDSVLHKVADLENMSLTLRQDRVFYPCAVVRRGETEVGLKFTGAPQPIERTTKRAERRVAPAKKGLLSWM